MRVLWRSFKPPAKGVAAPQDPQGSDCWPLENPRARWKVIRGAFGRDLTSRWFVVVRRSIHQTKKSKGYYLLILARDRHSTTPEGVFLCAQKGPAGE